MLIRVDVTEHNDGVNGVDLKNDPSDDAPTSKSTYMAKANNTDLVVEDDQSQRGEVVQGRAIASLISFHQGETSKNSKPNSPNFNQKQNPEALPSNSRSEEPLSTLL